jgi:hypothetical protein
MPNFGLSASLLAAARQIVEKKDDVKLTGGKTHVEVDPETNDRSESDEDTSTSKKKKKLDPVGKEDDDIDNDGDVDKSDSYLKNRRKAIGKAIKEEEQLDENLQDWSSKHEKIGNKITKNNKTATYHAFDKNGKHIDSYTASHKMKKEEVELDEVSKKTLGSYIKKAATNAAHAGVAFGSAAGDKDADAATIKKSMHTVAKRTQGIAKAADKLTKEDFTADELARIDEIAQSIFEIAAPGLDQNGKQKGINTNNDVTNAVLSDEKKLKMNKK